MSCQTLTRIQRLPEKMIVGTLRRYFNPSEITNHYVNMWNKNASTVHEQLGELLYYQFGRDLARVYNWNKMTFLQLEYEARVQGLISSGPHDNDEWKLRLMLETERRELEEASDNHDNEDRVTISVQVPEHDEMSEPSTPAKKNIVKNRGVEMVF